jgi:amino-acid N-acetyltransferase
VRLRLAAGNAAVVGRRSPDSLYDVGLASYGGEDRFDHEAAVGFISIWGLPIRTQAAVRGPFEDPDEEPLLGRLPTTRRDPNGNGGRAIEPPAPGSGAAAGSAGPRKVVSSLTAGASFQRRARSADVDAIHRINERYARRGILLSRTPDEIAEQIGSFRVAELDGAVAGIAALRAYGDGIGELRSLAVHDTAQGRGLGDMLVRAIVKDARETGVSRLYVLTANPGYFSLHGFEEIAWDDVPVVLDADRASGIARRRWNTAMVLAL